MLKRKSQPTALEWDILQHIWRGGNELSVRDVLESAYPDGEKAYTTVQTVMNNLVEKGYLTKQKTGLVNFYRAVEKRDETLRSAVHQMARKLFGGSVNELANFLVDSDALNRKELEELKKLLDEKTREGKENG